MSGMNFNVSAFGRAKRRTLVLSNSTTDNLSISKWCAIEVKRFVIGPILIVKCPCFDFQGLVGLSGVYNYDVGGTGGGIVGVLTCWCADIRTDTHR